MYEIIIYRNKQHLFAINLADYEYLDVRDIYDTLHEKFTDDEGYEIEVYFYESRLCFM